MNKITTIVALIAIVLLTGCVNTKVVKEVNGGTFCVIKSDGIDPMYNKAFGLFVDEMKTAGCTEVEKTEDADFSLRSDMGIVLVHRKEGTVWRTYWPNPNDIGFMENCRDKAAEFRGFLARKGEDPPSK
jgi:hypothetical protein